MHLTCPYIWLCIIICTYSVFKALYPPPPPGQTVAGQIVLLGDLCLNANSKGSFINSCAVPAPGGFSSAGASGLTQGSYDWNGSLRPVLQRRHPLQTPVPPQSSPPHRASCRAGNPVKTIAAGTVCTRSTRASSRNLPWKDWFERKHNINNNDISPGEGNHVREIQAARTQAVQFREPKQTGGIYSTVTEFLTTLLFCTDRRLSNSSKTVDQF